MRFLRRRTETSGGQDVDSARGVRASRLVSRQKISGERRLDDGLFGRSARSPISGPRVTANEGESRKRRASNSANQLRRYRLAKASARSTKTPELGVVDADRLPGGVCVVVEPVGVFQHVAQLGDVRRVQNLLRRAEPLLAETPKRSATTPPENAPDRPPGRRLRVPA